MHLSPKKKKKTWLCNEPLLFLLALVCIAFSVFDVQLLFTVDNFRLDTQTLHNRRIIHVTFHNNSDDPTTIPLQWWMQLCVDSFVDLLNKYPFPLRVFIFHMTDSSWSIGIKAKPIRWWVTKYKKKWKICGKERYFYSSSGLKPERSEHITECRILKFTSEIILWVELFRQSS